jgi:hypothetical protein
MIDRSAAIAIHLDNRGHLKTAAGHYACEQETPETEDSHLNKMP